MTEMMKKIKEKLLKQESGVTLVELLASIVLLTIIVTTFLSFFVQAGRTNNRIDDMNEATFLAQEQLELITAYSEKETVEKTKDKLTTNKNATNKNGYDIQTTFESKGDLQAVIVIVSKEARPLAQMETRLAFKK
ncbi:type IV pilus modification PilV family protein [Jeotgalibaca porci]|uniref:type IV pilus modification PilV family protein n=1 Tax=Jeotgalibaca porci TaxID=1868793 RepID=UPI003F909B31